jgi:hypothetical protein
MSSFILRNSHTHHSVTMKTLFLMLSISTISVSATSSSGPLKSGFGRTPEAEQVVTDAGCQPNGTSSIDFTRTFNNTPETWNWRINTTELAVPFPVDDLGKPEANYSQGLKVANIQWQLQWPGSDEEGSSFQSFPKARNATASFEAVIVNLPNNITTATRTRIMGVVRPFWVNSVSSLLPTTHHLERDVNTRWVLMSSEFAAAGNLVSADSYCAASCV